MTTDQQRWAALKAGNKAALAQIYEQEVDALYRYGRQLTPDTNLVEDAIQELFIELWNRRMGLGSTDAIRPYLLVALRRKITRKLQHHSQRHDSSELDDQQLGSVGSAESTLIDKEQNSQQQTRLQQALLALPDRQREVLYLKYFEGYDYKEIAELIGLNHQSVRNTATRALKALRKVMAVVLWWIFFIQMGTLLVRTALSI